MIDQLLQKVSRKLSNQMENHMKTFIEQSPAPQTFVKEARGSFFGLRVEVLKLQFCMQDKLRSPSYYIIISTYDQS